MPTLFVLAIAGVGAYLIYHAVVYSPAVSPKMVATRTTVVDAVKKWINTWYLVPLKYIQVGTYKDGTVQAWDTRNQKVILQAKTGDAALVFVKSPPAVTTADYGATPYKGRMHVA